MTTHRSHVESLGGNVKRKFLFLYIRTGSGHLAPAKSIVSYLHRNHANEIDPILVDGLDHSSKLLRKSIEEGYRHLQWRAKWLYSLIYALNKLPLIANVNNSVVARSVKPFLQEIILRDQPEKIVVFHFFLIKPVLEIVREHNLNIPVIVVVTDPFTVHPVWFYRKEPYFVVFSERAKQNCISRGIASDRVGVFPFVIDEKFSMSTHPTQIEQTKRKFGFDLSKKVVLIMGGGDGIPHGKAILRRVVRSNSNAEVVIVCGRNRSLFKAAMRIRSKLDLGNLTIYGYIDFVHELLSVSDVVISKCGASTFMQILLSKKVPIVNSYLWEQEKGTVEFLKESKVGIYEKNVRKLPALIHRFVTDPDFYASYQRNIEKASLENGTRKVAEFLMNFGTTKHDHFAQNVYESHR